MWECPVPVSVCGVHVVGSTPVCIHASCVHSEVQCMAALGM